MVLNTIDDDINQIDNDMINEALSKYYNRSNNFNRNENSRTRSRGDSINQNQTNSTPSAASTLASSAKAAPSSNSMPSAASTAPVSTTRPSPATEIETQPSKRRASSPTTSITKDGKKDIPKDKKDAQPSTSKSLSQESSRHDDDDNSTSATANITFTLTLPQPKQRKEGESIQQQRILQMREQWQGMCVRATVGNTSATSSSNNSVNHDQHVDGKNKYESTMQRTWNELCKKWGLRIVRQCTYVQREFWIDDQSKEKDQDGDINMIQDEQTTIIDGCRMEKSIDQLVITHLHSPSSTNRNGSDTNDGNSGPLPAESAGLKIGDVIDSINGVDQPSLKTIYDCMKCSTSMEIGVHRLESKIERQTRIHRSKNFSTTISNIRLSKSSSNESVSPIKDAPSKKANNELPSMLSFSRDRAGEAENDSADTNKSSGPCETRNDAPEQRHDGDNVSTDSFFSCVGSSPMNSNSSDTNPIAVEHGDSGITREKELKINERKKEDREKKDGSSVSVQKTLPKPKSTGETNDAQKDPTAIPKSSRLGPKTNIASENILSSSIDALDLKSQTDKKETPIIPEENSTDTSITPMTVDKALTPIMSKQTENSESKRGEKPSHKMGENTGQSNSNTQPKSKNDKPIESVQPANNSGKSHQISTENLEKNSSRTTEQCRNDNNHTQPRQNIPAKSGQLDLPEITGTKLNTKWAQKMEKTGKGMFPSKYLPPDYEYGKKKKNNIKYKPSERGFPYKHAAYLLAASLSNPAPSEEVMKLKAEDLQANLDDEKALMKNIRKSIKKSNKPTPSSQDKSSSEPSKRTCKKSIEVREEDITPRNTVQNKRSSTRDTHIEVTKDKVVPTTNSQKHSSSQIGNMNDQSTSITTTMKPNSQKRTISSQIGNITDKSTPIVTGTKPNSHKHTISSDVGKTHSSLKILSMPPKTITSTSSKAGLSQIKSTKLKRLYPDSSVFSKFIMKWYPPEAVQSSDGSVCFRGPPKSNGNLKQIPSTFKDTPEIVRELGPHILEEGLMGIKKEFTENSNNGLWTRPTSVLKLRSCTAVEKKTFNTASTVPRMYEFSFECNSKLLADSLGELFVLFSPSWKKSQCCLGFVGCSDINSTYLSDQKYDDEDHLDLLKVRLCVSSSSTESSYVDTGWLAESDLPTRKPDGSVENLQVHALNIGTCIDMLRQYEGLKSLDCLRPHLQKAVFVNPKDGAYNDKFKDEMNQNKPSSVITQVWDHLKTKMNTLQLSAIERVMSGKARENVALLQGPPGTGKTSTIIGLVSALLNGSVPLNGAKLSGTKVQIGRALSLTGGVNNSTVSSRVLICAPSNQAVDELCWRLHKGALGPTGKVGGFKLIRVGLLPNENRHDGRGRNRGQENFCDLHRERFLEEVNLDKQLSDISQGRNHNDFASQSTNEVDSSKKRRSRYINYSEERQKILSQSHVICCTLSGAGSKAFIDAVSRDEFPQSEFDLVIVDEACCCSEASCLIPFKFNPNAVVLVGDPRQLPVISFSKDAERCQADRSLFERLYDNGWPLDLIRIQYRMNEQINRFPSSRFYGGQLVTSTHVKERRRPIWHDQQSHINIFPPYLVWNHCESLMNRNPYGGVSNRDEANFVLKLLNCFYRQYGTRVQEISIGIIAFYNDQVTLIKQMLKSNRDLNQWLTSGRVSLQISTVDGFQGSEKDIIILSCVRSNTQRSNSQNSFNGRKQIGFLSDYRRVNVSLTRAKESLWIVGNCDYLRSQPLWNDLMNDANQRNLVANPSLLHGAVPRQPQKRPMNKGCNYQNKRRRG